MGCRCPTRRAVLFPLVQGFARRPVKELPERDRLASGALSVDTLSWVELSGASGSVAGSEWAGRTSPFNCDDGELAAGSIVPRG